MSSNADRLAAEVLSRRKELDLTQLDVWQAGGPSNTTLTKIESGGIDDLTRTTARKLDEGLQWERGSARAVWDGGKPTPLLEGGRFAKVLAELDRSDVSPETQKYIREALQKVEAADTPAGDQAKDA